ncbi:MAG: hypothetical protein COB67_07075 [SAR324 cluster bacterium]|uniref:TGS domain-containing protein n=1 Tax=SAR324 cluster bacterium TaxID=2024889 RepID=A0A2A4T483_9DELT|nr:MAG: hypothetical protein COB67_07075 [SAR324 cluster bacterium]
MIRVETIISCFQEYTEGQVDCTPLQKAYIIVAKAQHHFSNTSLQLSLEIAQVLVDLKLDIQSVVSGLLYGTFREGKIDLDKVRDMMGKETALILENLYLIPQKNTAGEIKQQIAENMRHMIFATSKDIRILFVNLAVRIVYMRHYKKLLKSRSEGFAQETLAIYSPIAERLGLAHIKVELEDLSFSCLHPKEFKHISNFCQRMKISHDILLEKLHTDITELLENSQIVGNVAGRIKHHYSIFRKAKKDKVDYEYIHDLIGVRIITNSIGECYKVLGLMHETYQPVVERYKDYISYPKPNGYQSLHTMVFTQDGFGFELQIRTEKMHMIAERGVASHWEYKAHSKDILKDKQTAWLHDLTRSLNITSDPKESLEIFTRELYSDFVYVFTPSGKIIKLPRGASVIDFAYEVHTEIGAQCHSALINGRKCSIKTTLNHGDKVKVLTSEQQEPMTSWLLFATTTRALSHIRSFLCKKEQQEAEKLGKELFSELLLKLELKKGDFEDSTQWKEFLQKQQLKDQESYFRELGFGKANIKDLQFFITNVTPQKNKKTTKTKKLLSLPFKKKQIGEGVRIAGIENQMVHYANCCNPVKGDPVVGVFRRGKGVEIHWTNCVTIRSQSINPERLVEVEWVRERTEKFPVRIHLRFDDRIRTSFSIIKVLDQAKVVLLENNLRLLNNISHQDIKIKVDNVEQLGKILKRLNAVPQVEAHRQQDSHLEEG